VIGFLLFLADGDKLNINKLKQLNLSQVDAIFKVSLAVFRYCRMVVLTFGDVDIKYKFWFLPWLLSQLIYFLACYVIIGNWDRGLGARDDMRNFDSSREDAQMSNN